MSAGQSTCESSTSWRCKEASPAGFQKIALGSLATATNASPSAVARAPTPLRRNAPEVVPTRWSPRLSWARAGPTAVTVAATTRIARTTEARRRSEVIVEREPPLRSGAVVRGVVHLRGAGVVRRVGHDVRLVRALAPDPALACDGIDATDDMAVEDVGALQAQIEPLPHEPEPAVGLHVERELHHAVLGVRLGRLLERATDHRDGCVGPAGLSLQVEVESHVAQELPVLGGLLVEPQIEIGRQLVGAVPAHECLGQPGLGGVAAAFLHDLLLGRVAALALGLLARVAQPCRPDLAPPLRELDLESLRARKVAVQVHEDVDRLA